MPNPNPQMFVHALNGLKSWPNPHALDRTAKFGTIDATSLVYSGRVMHLNASGLFEMGAKLGQMPLFLWPGQNDLDVSNPGLGTTDPYGWTSIAPAGNAMALVAVGAYELESTEYDTAQTYAYNDYLHAPTEDQITGADKSAAGLLTNKKSWPGGSNAALVLYTDSVCAVVSRPAHRNEHRQNVLTFWPVYLPGLTG